MVDDGNRSSGGGSTVGLLLEALRDATTAGAAKLYRANDERQALELQQEIDNNTELLKAILGGIEGQTSFASIIGILEVLATKDGTYFKEDKLDKKFCGEALAGKGTMLNKVAYYTIKYHNSETFTYLLENNLIKGNFFDDVIYIGGKSILDIAFEEAETAVDNINKTTRQRNVKKTSDYRNTLYSSTRILQILVDYTDTNPFALDNNNDKSKAWPKKAKELLGKANALIESLQKNHSLGC